MTAPIRIGMKPPHPGTFILEEVLEPLDLTISKAAEILGVRRATLSDFINAKTSLSPEMALRLEKAFGIDLLMMLRIQAWHDAVRMREHANDIDIPRYKQKTSAA